MVELGQPVFQVAAVFPIAGAHPLAGIEIEKLSSRPAVLRLAMAGKDSSEPQQATGTQQQATSAYLLIKHPLSVHRYVEVKPLNEFDTGA